MSQRFTVTALDRTSMGHPNYWRAGRSWPSGQEIEVEVLDQDDDPMETIEVRGEKRTFPCPTKIGRTSWARIVADKQLIKQPIGATVNEALQLQAENDQLKNELKTVLSRAQLAEAALLDANTQLASAVKQLAAARDEATEARSRAGMAEKTSEQLASERDELVKQLDQLTSPASSTPGKDVDAPQYKGKGQKRGG